MKSKITCFLTLALAVAVGVFYFRSSLNTVKPLVETTQVETQIKTEEKKEFIEKPLEAAQSFNYYEGVPSIDDQVAEYRSLTAEEIQTQLSSLENEMRNRNLIERANEGALSSSERKDFAALMQKEAALKLIQVRRQLDEAERSL